LLPFVEDEGRAWSRKASLASDCNIHATSAITAVPTIMKNTARAHFTALCPTDFSGHMCTPALSAGAAAAVVPPYFFLLVFCRLVSLGVEDGTWLGLASAVAASKSGGGDCNIAVTAAS
jgi:hypothetical protein